MIDMRFGNCEDILQEFSCNHFDTIITDPPYGIKFKNKKWDYSIPSIEIFKELLRVIKPGGTMLIFGGTRTYHRMAVNIEDAGWYISDMINWLHGQGFPKSVDISYMIDKNRNRLGGIQQVLKANNIMGEENNKDKIYITKPNSEDAEKWNGRGTSLKPSWEPIIVCNKPIEGNYDDNALKHGVSGYWIDGARIKTENVSFGIQRTESGRWPANIIFDEEAAKILDEENKTKPSRFFYCAKASRQEKGEYNTHETVKPLTLVKYLARLTKTPNKDIVLDPFSGSGTMGIACSEEKRDCVLIENDRESFDIQTRRIKEYEENNV